MTRIDEIVDGIYRIAIPPSDATPITFNQFLIAGERPALVHTGVHQAYDGIRKAIGEVIDVSYFNDHLRLERPEASDHGQVLVRAQATSARRWDVRRQMMRTAPQAVFASRVRRSPCNA